jgi:hypothetical protein
MANMIPISTVTVGSGGASSIAFNNIPQIYTDLCLKVSIRSGASANVVDGNITFNGSNSSFSWKELFTDGSSAISGSNTTNNALGQAAGNNLTANSFSSYEIYIPNYNGSNQKSFSVEFSTENNATLAYLGFVTGVWASTSPINSINIAPGSGTWLQYSSATLYGIRKY